MIARKGPANINDLISFFDNINFLLKNTRSLFSAVLIYARGITVYHTVTSNIVLVIWPYCYLQSVALV